MITYHNDIDQTENKRCLGRLVATELTKNEVDKVSGSATITGITNFEWVDVNGDGTTDGFRWEGDYIP